MLSTEHHVIKQVSRDWQFAAKMGARTKLVKIGTPAEEVAREIREEFFDSDGPHVTIECSGAESSIRYEYDECCTARTLFTNVVFIMSN